MPQTSFSLTQDAFKFGNAWHPEGWLGRIIKSPLGACGGMAFAALDYYHAGRSVPQGTAWNVYPSRKDPAGKVLRRYIWGRLWFSLALNWPLFVWWMAVLHLVPGGARILLRRSRREWSWLKQSIDDGHPVVLGLVGTTWNPLINHQVVACGYEDDGTVMVYDMNCPGKAQTIRLDFSGPVLQPDESCRSEGRGPLRGFFCEWYIRHDDPPQVDWPS